jgi:gamma-glutamyltranspeptidase/glutathione hydrolase
MLRLNRRQFAVQAGGLLGGWMAGANVLGSSAWPENGRAALPTATGDSIRGLGQDGFPDSASITAMGHDYAVATVHELASQAAGEAFQAGGNAVDAAVAASLMLAVVDGHNSGIGGGCFALIRDPQGQFLAIDGREEAGAAATPGMFLQDGRPQPERSQTGPLAPAVPGQIAALALMAQRCGRLAWERLVAPAIAVAENGFAMGRLAEIVRGQAEALSRFPESRRILLPDGQLPTATTILRQPDLARTLTGIARQGSDYFYRGPVAQAIAQHLAAEGGILTPADFANYQAKLRQPLETTYRGKQVHGFPLPSSGGIHIAQMLSMLELFDLQAIDQRHPATVYHLWLEVMQRAMADRAHWLGDADFAPVPSGLLDPTYLMELAGDIRLDTAGQVEGHGMPPAAQSQFFGDKHTTHLTTADREGWVVALTQTINTSFGSKMIVPGTGIVLNNQMDDFSIAPGVPNAFGLIGGQANAIAPGKRPLSSMSPTIVSHRGQPLLTCGAAGGPRIITCTLQTLSRVIDLGQTVAQALAAPRVHHQWRPAEAVVENRLDPAIVEDLRQRGHRIRAIENSATAQGLQWIGEAEQRHLLAAAEPRVGGVAVAK